MERHGEKWDKQEDELLAKRFSSGSSLEDLMRSHRRTFGGIKARLVKLGLVDGDAINTPPNAQLISSKGTKSFDKTKSKSSEEQTKRASSEEIGELTWDYDPETHEIVPFKGKSSKELPDRGSNREIDGLTWKYDIRTLHSLGEISNRLYNCLAKLGINDLGFCHDQSNHFFLTKKNFGRKTLRHLREVISKYMTPSEKEYQDIEIPRLEKSTWKWSGSTSRELSFIIDNIISTSLTPRSSEMVRLRYGFLGEEGSLTLQSIGKIYRISRERVRQIEAKAKETISTKIKLGHDREIMDLKTICAAVFDKYDSGKTLKIIEFCKQFYGSDYDWRMAAFIFSSLNIEPNLIDAEKMAQNLLRKESAEEARKIKVEKNKLKIGKLWEKILSNVISPTQARTFEDFIPKMDKICRSPNRESIGITGTFYSIKLFRNVLFESGIEKKILCLLDALDDILWFQEQPTEIKYEINGKNKSYYPDIASLNHKNQALVIEVKTLMDMFLFDTLIKSLSAIDYLNAKGIAFVITDERGRSISDLARVFVDEEVEKDFLNLIDYNKVVTWDIYRKEMKHPLSVHQFGSIVVRNNLSYSRLPFRLSRITSPNIGFDCFLK